MLKICVPSIVLLALAVLKASDKKKKIAVNVEPVKVQSPVKTAVYTAVLVVILLSVFRVVDYRISLVVYIVCIAILNYKLYNSWKDEHPANEKSPSYMAVFTIYNVIFLAIIGVVAWLLFLAF